MTQGKHLEWERTSVGPLTTSNKEGKKEKLMKEKVINGARVPEWWSKRQMKAIISPTWQMDVVASTAPDVCRSPSALGNARKGRQGRQDSKALPFDLCQSLSHPPWCTIRTPNMENFHFQQSVCIRANCSVAPERMKLSISPDPSTAYKILPGYHVKPTATIRAEKPNGVFQMQYLKFLEKHQ